VSTAAYSVSQFTDMVRATVAARPELEDVLVEGEISNLSTPSSGHIYFTLKDRAAALACVCFRSHALRIPFAAENGMTVVAHGHVEIYAQQGRYQLYVDALEPSGVGALALAVEQRKRALAAAGLFDERRKRALPLLPRRVVVVTSRTGAALRDVVTTMRRRAPCVDLVLSPATVQGDGAAETIVLALRRAARVRGADVVLLVRGGGALEDLMAFNEETVARAIFESPVPVVCGVGHETDLTIADLVADHRAATPSAAAEMTVPTISALSADLDARGVRLRRSLGAELEQKRRRADAAQQRLAQLSPRHRLVRLRSDVAASNHRLRAALLSGIAGRQRALEWRRSALALQSPVRQVPLRREQLSARARRLSGSLSLLQQRWRRELAVRDRVGPDVVALVLGRRRQLDVLASRLRDLSPLQVIERGYSITSSDEDGALVVSVAAAPPGTRLRTRLADGALVSEVIRALPASAERMYDDVPDGGT
jgi:exodeoxyribonuclease VII large subunit